MRRSSFFFFVIGTVLGFVSCTHHDGSAPKSETDSQIPTDSTISDNGVNSTDTQTPTTGTTPQNASDSQTESISTASDDTTASTTSGTGTNNDTASTTTGSSDTNPTDSDSSTPSDSVTDTKPTDNSDTSEDSTEDTDTTTDDTPNSDTGDVETDTDTSSINENTDTDSCEDRTCEDLGWECGVADPECPGGTLDDCKDCSQDGAYFCDDVDHTCKPCIIDDHCGANCSKCADQDTTKPACRGDAGSPTDATCVCTPESCADDEYCSTDGDCAYCNQDTACYNGTECINCGEKFPDNPRCNEDNDAGVPECVECTGDDHCRDGDEAPFNSHVGFCTPENTCTCYVSKTLEPESECLSQDFCPDNLICAQDFRNSSHYVCLSPCTISDENPPIQNGIACEERGTLGTNSQPARVWVPMTSCYAFKQHGQSCIDEDTQLQNDALCTADLGNADGICEQTGMGSGLYECTYRCVDGNGDNVDAWCPQGSTCTTQGDYCTL